jgi:hypothetical protein
VYTGIGKKGGPPNKLDMATRGARLQVCVWEGMQNGGAAAVVVCAQNHSQEFGISCSRSALRGRGNNRFANMGMLSRFSSLQRAAGSGAPTWCALCRHAGMQEGRQIHRMHNIHMATEVRAV